MLKFTLVIQSFGRIVTSLTQDLLSTFLSYKKIHLKFSLPIVLMFTATSVFTQENSQAYSRTSQPKRLINAFEIFVGPSLCFNYGNKFIENYKDENVQNKRLAKVGYTAGVGIYHSISQRIDLNFRLHYEHKGTNTELDVPLNPVNDDSRVIINSKYNYHYLSISFTPQITIGPRKKFIVALGGYFSRILKVNGYDKTHVLRDNTIDEASFEARLFRDLRSDGAVNSFTWMPGITGIERYDYGLIIGIGYKIPIKEKNIIKIQVQSNSGLRDINLDNPYELEEKNQTVSLVIGYTFQTFRNK